MELEQADEVALDIDDNFLKVLRNHVRRLVDAATGSLKQQLASAWDHYNDAVETIDMLEGEKARATECHQSEVAELTSQNLVLQNQAVIAEHELKKFEEIVARAEKTQRNLEKKVQRLSIDLAAARGREKVLGKA